MCICMCALYVHGQVDVHVHACVYACMHSVSAHLLHVSVCARVIYICVCVCVRACIYITCLESGQRTSSVTCNKVVELILCSITDINFAKQYVGSFLSHFLEGRFEGFARSTPLSMPVDHHELPCGLQVFEVFLGSDIVRFARRNVICLGADTSTNILLQQ